MIKFIKIYINKKVKIQERNIAKFLIVKKNICFFFFFSKSNSKKIKIFIKMKKKKERKKN
jgi:hypothetical protein